MTRTRVVVLFGGRSVEREVSRISARTIVGGLDPGRYDVIPIAVAPDGRFLPAPDSARLLADGRVPEKYLRAEMEHGSGALVPAEIGPGRADVVFPIIHGTTGEDGALQGFLEMLGLPYVGGGVTASAIGMRTLSARGRAALGFVPVLLLVFTGTVFAGLPVPTPTPTATATATATSTPVATSTPTPSPTVAGGGPGVGPASPVPTLSPSLLALLAVGLAASALFALRRSG